MSFRHDKKRGNHPITPKKGIKEVDLVIKEKGLNDRIMVAVKPNSNKSNNKKNSDKELEYFWNTLDIQVIPDVLQHSGNLQDDPFFKKYFYGSEEDFKKLNRIPWKDIPQHLKSKIKKYYLEQEMAEEKMDG